MITVIELCMTQQPSYKVLFTLIEIDLHLWSLSDCKQPSLWPLLCKKVYTTVYFPWILQSSRGRLSKIVSKCFLQVFKGFKYCFQKRRIFDECPHFSAYRATLNEALRAEVLQYKSYARNGQTIMPRAYLIMCT